MRITYFLQVTTTNIGMSWKLLRHLLITKLQKVNGVLHLFSLFKNIKAWDSNASCLLWGILEPSDGITWDLNMKSYEDFGFEDDDESLQQVVVENPKPMSRNSSFLNVITGAIRKISSFGKLPSSEASSKNELQNVRKLYVLIYLHYFNCV